MNIQELTQKVKELKDRLATREVYTVLLIMVVGFGSFGLGRLSKLQESREPIRIEQLTASVGASESPLPKGVSDLSRGGVVATTPQDAPSETILKPGGKVVASKGGTKYHFPWCSGAQRISEGNKVWFNSTDEARKAGYTPATNCKGLK